jgi:hypothetical protein
MGYYTHYTLTVVSDPNQEILGEEGAMDKIASLVDKKSSHPKFSTLPDELKEALQDGYLGEMVEGDDCMTSDGDCKWYHHEDDFRALSSHLRDTLLCVQGKGEEDDDVWRKYFLNGKMQHCHGKVTISYPEFNIERMK